MAANLSSLIAAINADPGLKSSISAGQIAKGVVAANLMNSVLIDMIEQTSVNGDGRISAGNMQTISDALWKDENAASWRDFWVGHGNDNGDVVSGFHWVQNDGGSMQFQGRNFIDTVADAIYHYGFKAKDGRYFNEDGNDNETLIDVAGWLNYFLNGENIVYGTGGGETLGSGVYSEYFAAARAETFLAGSGNDEIWADRGNDKVYGGGGNDRSGGGTGHDRMYGEDGNDTLYGESGADRLYGGAGYDVMGGGADGDTLDGGSYSDRLSGEDGADWLTGGSAADTLSGDASGDRLEGGSGDDKAYGGTGGDKIYGNDGNDELVGGAGADHLRGGAGADEIVLWDDDKAVDTLYFGKGDSGRSAATMDLVEGFVSGKDKINLESLGALTFKTLDFAGGGKGSVYFDGHYLRVDTDGDRATDMMVEFTNMARMQSGDFIFG